ncbi:BEL1-like homeodomain protein 6 [Abeliophyllum distichum]|uniref:BEL1-like homeodomain protein 6 n=1 Tax=Abeliophyllum distichum TaxID=126358 RepID=A0ABD1P899_9LAMI
MGGVSGILQGATNLEGRGFIPESQYTGTITNEYVIYPIKQSRYNEYMLSDVPGSNSDAIKANIPAYGVSSIASAIPNSKYLKAAQQLLDEVVNVRQAIMEQHKRNEFMKTPKETDGESVNGTSDHSAVGTSSIPQESSSISPDLSAAKKQDVQDRITKLLSMFGRG